MTENQRLREALEAARVALQKVAFHLPTVYLGGLSPRMVNVDEVYELKRTAGDAVAAIDAARKEGN